MTKVKTKGAYSSNRGWHQNHSALVVPKAVEAFYVQGTPMDVFLENHLADDEGIWDFFLRAKVDRSSRLVARDSELGTEEELPRTTRYYAALSGPELIKIMPPRKRKVTQAMQAAWKRAGFELSDDQIEAANEKMQKIEPVKYADLGLKRSPDALIQSVELLIAEMQPKEREIAIDKGQPVAIVNTFGNVLDMAEMRSRISLDYYLDKAEDLLV